MTTVVISPIGMMPVQSGMVSRVNSITNALQEMGMDLIFVLIPNNKYQVPVDIEGMRNALGPNSVVIFGEREYKGRILQRWLNCFQRILLKMHWIKPGSQISDFMYADGYIKRQTKKAIKRLIRDSDASFVVVEYALYSGYIKGLDRQVKTIVDMHDLFQGRNAKIRRQGGSGYWYSFTPRQEIKLLNRFDHIIAIQHHEAQKVAESISRKKIHTIGILAGPKEVSASDIQNNVIGFLGSSAKFNIEGMNAFFRTHWEELLQRVPDLCMLLGGQVSESFTDAESVSPWTGIDARDFYSQCDFIINPCLSGTGLQIKSVEALQYGKPLITTKEGARGIEELDGICISIHPLESEEFLDACIEMICNVQKRIRMGTAALEYISKRYNQDTAMLRSIFQ